LSVKPVTSTDSALPGAWGGGREKAVAALNDVTAEFAARRMDRGVARALAGRRVDALG
jgi:hypothetical protein